MEWSREALEAPPEMLPAPGFEEPEVRALFYVGFPWKGKPTRVFAGYGSPAREAGEKLPAMVLVPGGGGTAFADWVRLGNERGCAPCSCGPYPVGDPCHGGG